MLRLMPNPLLVHPIHPKTFHRIKPWLTRNCISTRHTHSQFKKACVTSSGIEYKVYYEDHGPEQCAGVVLCVHGDPGFSNNFEELVKPLVKKDIRIIIPNFPGYGTTHSTQRGDGQSDWLGRPGRNQLLLDFIGILGLKSIDVLVSHSAGTWSAIAASAHNESVRSVCFLNPVGHRPHRTLRPYIPLNIMAGLLRSPLKRLLEPLLVQVYNMLGFSVSGSHKRDLITSSQVAFSVDFKQVNRDISLLESKKLPSVMVLTKNDKIVECSIPHELGPMIGIPPENFVEYNQGGEITNGNDKKDFLSQGIYKKGFSMERGGHFVQRAYPKLIAEELIQLIQCVQKSSKR